MKRVFIILGCLALVIGAFELFKNASEESSEREVEMDSIEKTRYDKLLSALTSSEHFKDSTFTPSDKLDVLNVDETYDISIRSGNYVMTIKDTKLEGGYCELVDAIEQSLGHSEGASIETCLETLNGTIELGGLSAEIYDTYKVLTVNSEEPAKLYKVSSSRESDELISVDETDYDVSVDDFVITSVTTNYAKESKLYKVCGNVFNPKKDTGTLNFKIFDEQKEELATKEYTYQNDTKKYVSFCIDFTLDLNGVKYYSIGGV